MLYFKIIFILFIENVFSTPTQYAYLQIYWYPSLKYNPTINSLILKTIFATLFTIGVCPIALSVYRLTIISLSVDKNSFRYLPMPQFGPRANIIIIYLVQPGCTFYSSLSIPIGVPVKSVIVVDNIIKLVVQRAYIRSDSQSILYSPLFSSIMQFFNIRFLEFLNK